MNVDLQVLETVVTNLVQKVTGEQSAGNVGIHVAPLGGAPIVVVPDDATLYNASRAISGLISAAPTRLLDLDVRNVGAALHYLMLFDVAALPVANGTAPDFYPIIPIPAGATYSNRLSAALTTAGLAWYASSTDLTLTAAVGNNFEVGARHRP